MRNLYLTLMGIFVVAMLTAQPTDKLASSKEDKKLAAEKEEGWSHGGNGSLTFNQIGLKNWSAGGDNSISFLLSAGYFADLKKGKSLLQTKVFADYGIQRVGKQGFRKNADRLELFAKYGFQIDKKEKWYFATLANFRTQFTKTHSYSDTDLDNDGRLNDKTGIISKFASPGVLEFSVGVDYVPNDKFSLFMSPIAAKWLIVADPVLVNTAQAANPLLNVHGTEIGQKVQTQIGALAVANYNHQVHENVSLNSTLKLYKDYLNGPAQNIDVDWQTGIGLKVTKFISASVFTHLIYDYDVAVINDAGETKRLQFKEIIGVGFSYAFKAKTKAEKSAIE